MKLSSKMHAYFMIVAIFPILVNLANFFNMSQVGEKNKQIRELISSPIPQSEMVEKIKAEVEAIKSVSILASIITWSGILVGLLLAFIAALILSRIISNPIVKVISGMTMATTQVATSSSQLVAGSHSLAKGASNQAASLQEISSSMEQMASMTKRNAENAENANELSEEVSKLIDAGMSDMDRMSQAINKIKESANETVNIIKTIDEIAFQTNLLALNAAVEAARAGDAGKGFAVVAEEVRNLAQRSAEAAKNTAVLIEQAQASATSGVNVVEDMAKNLKVIQETESNASVLIAGITTASREQAHGIEQVNRGVGLLDKVTQANAGNAQESASACEELSSQSRRLGMLVGSLKAIIGDRGDNSLINLREDNSQDNWPAQSRNMDIATTDSLSDKQPKKPHKEIPLNPSQVIPLDDSDFEDF
jgi:methyl-accepting chemotaxis protein